MVEGAVREGGSTLPATGRPPCAAPIIIPLVEANPTPMFESILNLLTDEDEPSTSASTETVEAGTETVEEIASIDVTLYGRKPPTEDRPFVVYRGFETTLRSYSGPGGTWRVHLYTGTRPGAAETPTELAVGGRNGTDIYNEIYITTSPAMANDTAYGLARGTLAPSEVMEEEGLRCESA